MGHRDKCKIKNRKVLEENMKEKPVNLSLEISF